MGYWNLLTTNPLGQWNPSAFASAQDGCSDGVSLRRCKPTFSRFKFGWAGCFQFRRGKGQGNCFGEIVSLNRIPNSLLRFRVQSDPDPRALESRMFQ